MEVHLDLIDRDIQIDGHLVRIHCHCLAVDANGRVQPGRLAAFMRNAIADYAIPRSQMAKAKERDQQFNSTEAVAELVERARKSFTHLANTGEGGELLLFLLAERFLKLPQILCKMDLKTDSSMHYHGADGVYASVTDDGVLKLFWGESKIYKGATDAIRDCLSSLAPFLIEPDGDDAERERDLILLSDKAQLSDDNLTEALKKYFDKSSPMSKRVKYCGVALVGFDADIYPPNNANCVADEISAAAKTALADWAKRIGARLKVEKLEQVELEFFCLPLPSADEFRTEFLKAMGLSG